MIEKNDCVKVGIIAKSHGVNGEVVVRADAGFDVDDLSYEFLLIEIDGGLVPFYVEEIRVKNNEDALVKFELVDTQEETRRMTGRDVYICREWAETEEGDLEDVSTGMLIGYMAFDKSNGRLGLITEIDDQVGANPLFVIDSEGDELLVPIADEFIKEINDEERTVVFELPEGLVDMNK